MRALCLMLLLAGCSLFEPLPPVTPAAIDPASRAAILDWALWAPRPRAQYAEPATSSEPVFVYPVDRFGFSYRSGQTRGFIRY